MKRDFYKISLVLHIENREEGKLAKTDRKFQYLWSCKKIYNWGGNGKEKGVREEAPEVKKGQQGSESICYFNRQINKEKYHLLPSLSPWKTYVPKFMPIPRCEYSVK